MCDFFSSSLFLSCYQKYLFYSFHILPTIQSELSKFNDPSVYLNAPCDMLFIYFFFINHASPQRCYVSQAALLLISCRTNGGTTWHICWPGWMGRRAVMTSWCLFHALLSADVGGPLRKLWAIQDWELFFSAERDDAETVGAKNKKIKNETGRLHGRDRRFFFVSFFMVFISFSFFVLNWSNYTTEIISSSAYTHEMEGSDDQKMRKIHFYHLASMYIWVLWVYKLRNMKQLLFLQAWRSTSSVY